MTKKIVNKPYINFCCESAHDVTQSGYHVRFQNYSILVDFGLYQAGNDILKQYKINKDLPKGLKPKELDMILVTHINADHIGRIPMLYANGCQCPCFITKGSLKFLKLMWEDSFKILTSDTDKIQRKHGINAKPLYTMEDIDIALSHVVEVDFKIPYYYTDNVAFEFYSAEHIIHSAQILLTLQDGYVTKRIGFTGDIGSNQMEHYYLKEFQPLPFCDYLIGECTYADMKRTHSHKDRRVDLAKIKSVVEEAQRNKSRILIPIFTLDRCEQMLTTLYNLFNGQSPLPIYIDSPLACKIANIWDSDNTDNWETVYKWKDVTWVSEYTQSKALQESNTSCIILASSGMLTSGRALQHLQHILPNPNNTIMFCGYSAEETLASQIKSGKHKTLEIDGEYIDNKANLVVLNSFSSHKDCRELLQYYTQVPYNKIYLVHGQQNDKVAFSKELQNQLYKLGRSSKVIATNFQTKCHI